MELGLGTSHLAEYTKLDLRNYFSLAKKLGYCYIDTSPLYSASIAERILGGCLSSNLEYKIITKFGLPYYDLGTSRDKIRKRLSKTKGTELAWGSHMSPKLIPRELKKSLSRLKVNNCFAYLMHSIDSSVNLESWVEPLIMVKQAGLVQQIGLSIDCPLEANFSWADIIQIPASLTDWAKSLNFHGTMMINGFARVDVSEIEHRIAVAKKSFPQAISLIRSSSIDHLSDFADLVKKNYT